MSDQLQLFDNGRILFNLPLSKHTKVEGRQEEKEVFFSYLFSGCFFFFVWWGVCGFFWGGGETFLRMDPTHPMSRRSSRCFFCIKKKFKKRVWFFDSFLYKKRSKKKRGDKTKHFFV